MSSDRDEVVSFALLMMEAQHYDKAMRGSLM
jgi:hypothetical protein